MESSDILQMAKDQRERKHSIDLAFLDQAM
jgi:hypothetical protein